MSKEEPVTLESQFYKFAKIMDNERSGSTINLFRSDYWMRQAGILEDRRLNMTDTGIIFSELSKTELNYTEWVKYLKDLCKYKQFDEEKIRDCLINCGVPGEVTIKVPRYRDYFLTYKPLKTKTT